MMKRSVFSFLSIFFIVLIAEARQPRSGYRGFLEWSSSMRYEHFGVLYADGSLGTSRESTLYAGVTTSHGYQINPLFFIGMGLGMEHCSDIDNWIAPVFIHGRVDLKLGKLTPFGDIRMGTNIAEGTGIYFSPSVGYRYNWGRKMGINLGVGLSLAGYKAEHYDCTWLEPDSYEIHYVGVRHHVRSYFSFRIGIDF